MLFSHASSLRNNQYFPSQKLILKQRKFTLHLFDFFKQKPEDSKPNLVTTKLNTPLAGKSSDDMKIQALKSNLEKISNKQNRDYEKEAREKKVEPIRIRDKQSTCYNYNKLEEFPNLYKGWIRNEGDQIGKQITLAAKKAIQSNEKYIEILFDPVPNLDEVAVGTAWNQRFRLEISNILKVPDYVTNRGGPATLEWSNIYWANRLAEELSRIKPNIVALSLSGQGIPQSSKGIKPTLHSSLTFLLFNDGIKPTGPLLTNQIKTDLIIILSPCQQNHYKDAKMLGDKLNVPVIALNAPYSYIYDVGGGAPYTLAYVMKRIPKGWVYRLYPKPFEIIIEGPDYEIKRVATVPKQPSLVEITKISMSKSTELYGSTGNDRIFENRL